MKAILALCVLLGIVHTALLQPDGRRRRDASPEELSHKLPCTEHESNEITMCLNGGECFAVEVNSERHVACSCADGWAGTRCENRAIDPDILG
ncbi:pro-neuregulin-3, membrane-bound isoform-like isoform X4 [Oculina patagonica]